MMRRGLRVGGRPGRGRRPWFGPKRFGGGIRPVTWQGWLVMIVVAATIFLIVHAIHG